MKEVTFKIMQIYLTYTALYTAWFSVASFFYRSKIKESRNKKSDQNHSIAVIIPVYREDEIILQSTTYTSKQLYSQDHFEVIVVADSLKSSTVEELKDKGVRVVKVNFINRTKAKAIHEALKYMRQEGNHEISVILDADNVMDKSFLANINKAYTNGYMAIQGQRTAKNENSNIAVLDGLSETINNAIFRKGYAAMGLSAPLIGSGMAFNTELLTSIFDDMNLNSKGEDRELQLDIIKRNHRIYYLEEAIVYDEKVDNGSAFEQQRKRWILNQYLYLVRFFPMSMNQLLKGNFSYFNISFLSAIQLPRILNIGSFLIGITALKLANKDTRYSVALMIIYLSCLILVIPRNYYKKSTLGALVSLPKTFGLMVSSLFNAHRAHKQFLHTSHSTKHEIEI